MVHLVEIFRDEKLLRGKQTHTKKQVSNQITNPTSKAFGGDPFKLALAKKLRTAKRLTLK